MSKKIDNNILKPIIDEIKKMSTEEISVYLNLGKDHGIGKEMKSMGCNLDEIDYCYHIMYKIKLERLVRGELNKAERLVRDELNKVKEINEADATRKSDIIELTLHQNGKQKKYKFHKSEIDYRKDRKGDPYSDDYEPF